MALLDNSIGPYNVAGWFGQPVPPSEQLAVEERDGVDGTEITKLGRKGQPFPLVSFVDCADIVAARAQLRDYLALKSEDPMDLVHAGVSTNIVENYLVQVLDVRSRTIGAIRGLVGGLHSNSQAILIAEWLLLPIPTI